MIRKFALIASAMALTFNSGLIQAKVSETEAAKLGAELTPVGAVKAGNADGSIPAWTGGITEPPAGYSKGDHHPDPFADDKVLFTITAKNYQEYAEFLSDGQKELFKAYPDTYKMPIYQSRRSASLPKLCTTKPRKMRLWLS